MNTLVVLPLLVPLGVAAQEVTLGSAVESALLNHPSVEIASSRAAAARQRLRSDRAELWPSLSIEGSATRFQEDMIVRPLHAFDPARPPEFNPTLLQASANASFTIWDGSRSGRLGASRHAASAEAVMVDRADQLLTMQVIDQYTRTLALRQTFLAARSRVDAILAEVERSTQMYEAEVAPMVSVLRSRGALERARADLAGAEARLNSALGDLTRTAGWDLVPDIESIVMVDVDSAVPDELRELTVERNPVVEAAELRAEASHAAVSSRKGQWWPDVIARAAYRVYAAPSNDVTGEWQLGLQLSYPIFTGGRRGAAIDEARARQREAEATAADVRLELETELQRALASFTEADARVSALTAALAQFEEVRRIELLSLEAGTGVQVDYLDAEATLFETQALLASARAGRVTAAARVLLAAGMLDVQNLERITREMR